MMKRKRKRKKDKNKTTNKREKGNKESLGPDSYKKSNSLLESGIITKIR